jgi:hypothetical protein
MNITAPQFFHAWLSSVNERKLVLADNWRNAKKFTSLVKSSEGGSLIQSVAGKIGLKCYPHDYYSVDSVLYQECDLVPDIPEGSTWLRALSVAFEHENFIGSGIYKEVSHLLIMNADLRVLVAYPTDGIDDQELVYAHSIIKGARHAQEVSDRESFLLILGHETGYEWEGFVYKQDAWKKI